MGLFVIVKTQVGQLIIYLTREILTMPSCAGESTCAFAKNIKVFKVLTPGFMHPEEEVLSNMTQYLDLSSCSLEK